MSMNSDKDGAQSKVTIRLTDRQETILKKAQKSTGVSFGSLIWKCINMNLRGPNDVKIDFILRLE